MCRLIGRLLKRTFQFAKRVALFVLWPVIWLFCKIKNWFCPPNGGTGSGTGGNGDSCDKDISIKMVRCPHQVIGKGMHRSGWPYVYKHLQTISSDDGILFDDFVEQTFCYVDKPAVYNEPWVGVFHHPPNPPCFSNERESLRRMFKENCAFKASLPNLKMAIALSDHLADYLRTELDCPVLSLKHPIGTPRKFWCPEAYKANKDKRIIQVGCYLRNTQLLHQFLDVCGHSKWKPALTKDWMKIWDDRVRRHWSWLDDRSDFCTEVKTYNFYTPSQYDELLTKNVVAMEFFDLSAANGILDCIARNTPVIVNRHPAAVEYLGPYYPLFFDHPEQIPHLMTKVNEAHEYLKAVNKTWIQGENFVSSLVHGLKDLK